MKSRPERQIFKKRRKSFAAIVASVLQIGEERIQRSPCFGRVTRPLDWKHERSSLTGFGAGYLGPSSSRSPQPSDFDAKMLSLTAACSPVLVKSCALLGFKAAFFHASGFCQEKWSFKFKSALNGRCGSMEKDYFNYIKRKRRADAKKDLLKWRSFEIYTNEFDQLYWSCGSKSSSKSQKQRSGGQKWSEGCEETSGHKKRKRCSEANQGASQKEFWNDPFQFIWQSEKSHYNQWWAFAWSSFSQDCRSANNRRSNFTHGFSSGSDSNGSTDSTGKEKVEMEATVGSPSERQSLGLRPTGSLTMEELKKAFRLSALKWHPDRHEGASKVGAEAKFKDCAAAYKSLLTALAKA